MPKLVIVALFLTTLAGWASCRRPMKGTKRSRRTQQLDNGIGAPRGYSQQMYTQNGQYAPGPWSQAPPGQFQGAQQQQFYPQGPAGFQQAYPGQQMPIPNRNLEGQAPNQGAFDYQTGQPQGPGYPEQLQTPNLGEAVDGSGPAPRQMQGTDFVTQYNNLMRSRVDSLNNQFPWSFRPDDCDLAMEIFPFYYTPILRSANLRIMFSSNCLTTRDVTLEVTFDDELFVNWIYHPTTVYLNLWNNVYRLEFSRPAVIDRYDVMKSLEYTMVTVFNANQNPQTFDLNFRNVVYLRPQAMYSFNRSNMRKLRNVRGYFSCEKTSRRLQNWEVHSPRRDELVNRLRSQGESEENILIEVDKFMAQVFQMENSSAATPYVPPSAEELRNASFEVKEEVERLKAREIAKKAFMREFIEEFEIDCQIM